MSENTFRWTVIVLLTFILAVSALSPSFFTEMLRADLGVLVCSEKG